MKRPKSNHGLRFMIYVKNHWFKAIVITFAILFLFFCVIVILSPRKDLQKRGFIPCTETMAEKLLICQGKVFCSMKSILQNAYCDSKVVAKGLVFWVQGKQNTPWANYMFEADMEEGYDDAEALEEFYKENPNIVEEMQKLKELHKELENGKSENTDTEEKK